MEKLIDLNPIKLSKEVNKGFEDELIDEYGPILQSFEIKNGYIFHGELNILRTDKQLNVICKQCAKDIFFNKSIETSFGFFESGIKAFDWLGNYYVFDFNGNIMKDVNI